MSDVVLVHGLWFRAPAMRALARRLGKNGFRTHLFSYPSRSMAIDEQARQLKEFCRGLETERLDFVAHSLGGLVVLAMLQRSGELPLGRIVLLGTPLGGSAVARRVSGWRVARSLLGKTREALGRGAGPLPDDHQIGVVAGTRAVGLGRISGGLDGPSDGVVMVAETLAAGLTDHLSLKTSHTGMLFSRRVSGHVAAFLRAGRFSREHAQQNSSVQ